MTNIIVLFKLYKTQTNHVYLNQQNEQINNYINIDDIILYGAPLKEKSRKIVYIGSEPDTNTNKIMKSIYVYIL